MRRTSTPSPTGPFFASSVGPRPSLIVAPRYTTELRGVLPPGAPAVLTTMSIQFDMLEMASALGPFGEKIMERGESLPGGSMEPVSNPFLFPSLSLAVFPPSIPITNKKTYSVPTTPTITTSPSPPNSRAPCRSSAWKNWGPRPSSSASTLTRASRMCASSTKLIYFFGSIFSLHVIPSILRSAAQPRRVPWSSLDGVSDDHKCRLRIG